MQLAPWLEINEYSLLILTLNHKSNGNFKFLRSLLYLAHAAQRITPTNKWGYLPDSTAGGIQVVSRHRANDGSWRSVLVHFHRVGGLGEDRRLIHVQDIHLDCCWILEGPKMKETGVQLCVWRLNLEGVGLLCLIVKSLQKQKSNERERQRGMKP